MDTATTNPGEEKYIFKVKKKPNVVRESSFPWGKNDTTISLSGAE